VRKLCAKDIEWCYFGTDISQRDKIARILSYTKKVSIGEELDRIAYDIKKPFLEWMAEIGRQQKDKVNWWASRLASKSPLQTDFFLLVCYTQLVNSWLRRDRRAGARIVVIKDPWLRWLLRREFARDGRVAFSESSIGDCLLNAAYWVGRIPLAMGYVLLWSLGSMLMARRFFPRGEEGLDGCDRQAVLLYTWIDQRCFLTPGKLLDSCTGRLDEILIENGECVRRLTPLQVSTRFLPSLEEFSSLFIVSARYLRLKDITFSLWSWFKIHGLNRVSRFRGWDYKLLLYRESLHESKSFPGVKKHRWSIQV